MLQLSQCFSLKLQLNTPYRSSQVCQQDGATVDFSHMMPLLLSEPSIIPLALLRPCGTLLTDIRNINVTHNDKPPSLCLLFLSLSQLARRCSVPCLSTRWKRVRRWVWHLTLLFSLPQWRVECLNSNLSLCCVRECSPLKTSQCVCMCFFMSCWLQL